MSSITERPDNFSALAQRITKLELAVADIRLQLAARQAPWSSKPIKRHPLDPGPKTAQPK